MNSWKGFKSLRFLDPHWMAVIILTCSALLYHAPHLLKKQVYYSGDIIHQHFPNLIFARQSLSEGKIPLWNPYQFSGFPFLADPGSQMLYPPAWILLLIEPQRVLMGYIILHYILAGIFMYSLLCHLGINRWPAIAASIAFMFSGFLLLNTSDWPPFCTYAWIPLVMLMASRSAKRPTLKSGCAFGLSLAIQLLSGNAQLWLGTLYFSAIFWVVQWIYHRRTSCKESLYQLAQVAIGIMVGLSITAVQVIPSWELAQQSIRREGLSYDISSLYSLAPVRLFSILIPQLWEPATWPEVVKVGDGRLGYIGVSAVTLAVLAIILLPHKKEVHFFAISAIGFIALSVGRYGFLYLLVYKFLPGFHLFRAPVRYLSFFVFCACILVGFALEFLEKPNWPKVYMQRLTVGALALLLIMTLGPFAAGQPYKWGSIRLPILWWGLLMVLLVAKYLQFLSTRGFGLLVLVLIFVELFVFGSQAHLPVASADILRFEPLQPIAEYLKKEADYFRVYWPNNLRVEDKGVAYEAWALSTMIYGISNVEGYNQLKLYNYDLFWRTLPFTRALELLNVKYAILSSPLDALATEQMVFSDNGLFVYKLSTHLPRAYVVAHWSHSSISEMLSILSNASFDPAKEVLLEAIPTNLNSASGLDFEGKVQFLSYEPESLEFLVSLSQPGILVVNEPFYPGWKCKVDGQETQILRANVIFRAVALKKGIHRVQMFFSPGSVKLGSAVSLLGIIGALVLLLIPSHQGDCLIS